ncbi:hypothetical protein SFRURICE_012358 [Spodoptera frugiperda]|nr:hypothetical protein SFRURICE_012358 [Spodoptera frugiperda]
MRTIQLQYELMVEFMQKLEYFVGPVQYYWEQWAYCIPTTPLTVPHEAYPSPAPPSTPPILHPRKIAGILHQ